MNKTSGFTLIELLLYVAIFAMVAGMFTGILVVILRVQGQQSGLVEVSDQLSFADNRIQNLIRASNPSVTPAIGVDEHSVTLSIDGAPTMIALADNAIQVNGVALTTEKVRVTDLRFTLHTIANPSTELGLKPSYSIDINITMENSDTNPQNHVSRTLKASASSIAQ